MARILLGTCVFAALVALLPAQDAPHRGDISSHAVPPGMMYHRVWAVMPVGGNPRHPLLLPVPAQPGVASERQPDDRSGILGFQLQMSDDGQSALVEMVFATPMAFQDFLQAQARSMGVAVPSVPNTPSSPATQVTAPGAKPSALAPPSAAQVAIEAAVPGLKMFERGKASDQDVLTEFRKHKANFTFGNASVRVQARVNRRV